MKKMQFILGMCFILLAMMTGCRDSSMDQGKEIVQEAEVVSKEEPLYNTAFEKYDEDEVIALVLDQPGDEIIEGLTQLETYTYYEDMGRILIIPKYNGTKIEVKKVVLDGEKIVEGETLYSNSYKGDDYGLLIEANRPEGLPELFVSVSIGSRQSTFMIAEDGKDGVPALGYLKADEEEQTKQGSENEEVDEQKE